MEKYYDIHIIRMGAISFLIYDSTNLTINSEFTNTFMHMKNRGPDNTSYIMESTPVFNTINKQQVTMTLSKREISEYRPINFVYGYHRLAVNDMTTDGSQPFEDPIVHKIGKYPDIRFRPKRKLICNGEIYNYKQLLSDEEFTDKDLQSESDVEIIMPLYIKYGIEETLKKLNGDFAFVLTENVNSFDLKNIQIYVARDIFGIKPLYMIKHKFNLVYMFVSELKGIPKFMLNDINYVITEVPPGTYWSYQNSVINKNNNEFISYINWDYYKDTTNCIINTTDSDTLANVYKTICEKLTKSVVNRIHLNLPIGVLLSGGFDSSIILSIMIRYLKENNYDFNKYKLSTFVISNDKEDTSATECVEFLEKYYNIDIKHHNIGINDINLLITNVDNVIYNVESCDPSIIRGSLIFDYLLKYIKEYTDVKILMSGEGLDELCGYKQLFNLNETEFQTKTISLINNISKFDILRMDKLSGIYGLEIRHPFLDIDFVEYILSIHPKLKMPQVHNSSDIPIEKYIIRKSFDLQDYLPENNLWKPMNDITNLFNVNLTDLLDDLYNNKYTDTEFYNYINNINNRDRKPKNKQEMHYKKIFESYFTNANGINNIYWNDIWK
jgi:asparagine synthase (glutamine-hydrolysing)